MQDVQRCRWSNGVCLVTTVRKGQGREEDLRSDIAPSSSREALPNKCRACIFWYALVLTHTPATVAR